MGTGRTLRAAIGSALCGAALGVALGGGALVVVALGGGAPGCTWAPLDVPDGTRFRCERGECPAGTVCGATGYCEPPGTPDAPVPLDADPRDADPRDATLADAPPPDGAAADGARADALAPDGAPPDAEPPAAWWNASWRSRRRLVVTNVGSAALPAGATVVLSLDFATSATDQGGRLIRHAPAATELARHIDADVGAGGQERVWFRLQAPIPAGASDRSYYLYYDHPSAPWGGEGAEVLDHLSLFASGQSLAENGFAESSAGCATVNWGLRLSPGCSARTTTTWPAGKAVDLIMHPTSVEASFGGGFARTSDFQDGAPYMKWIYRGAAGIAPERDVASLPICTGTAAATAAEEHLYSVERLADHVVFRLDLGEPAQATCDLGSFSTALQVKVDNDMTGPDLWVDEVHVRDALDPPPVVGAGAEEAAP